MCYESTHEALRYQDPIEFSMEEVFDGLLAGLITKSIPDLQPAFDEFARCLKLEAETG